MYRTGYAYSYASYHRQVVRTEQTPLMAAWENSNRVTYKYDGMELAGRPSLPAIPGALLSWQHL